MSTAAVAARFTHLSRNRCAEADGSAPPLDAVLRAGRPSDVDAVHRLVSTQATEGRLLARPRADIADSIRRFVVATDGEHLVGCADLAPLSRRVAEVRSLVVEPGARSCGIGRRLVEELQRRATASGFEALTAFTHTAGYFARMGFSIVPHGWVPEKIETDCRTCEQFRRCGQHAVMLPLARTISARRVGF